MPNAGIQVFLSQSFRDDDRRVVELVEAIAKAFGLLPVTVDSASPATPPREATRLLKKSAGLIAVVTRRDELTSGGFRGPQAVYEEVAMADSHELPVMLFYENGIDISGFGRSFGTYMEFNRADLCGAETLRRLVASVRVFRAALDAEQRGWFRVGPARIANRFDRVVYGLARDERGLREPDTLDAQLRYRAIAILSLWLAQELELANAFDKLPVQSNWSVHSDTRTVFLVAHPLVGDPVESERVEIDHEAWALAGSRVLAQQLMPVLLRSLQTKLTPSSA